jgi:hypothetical protein
VCLRDEDRCCVFCSTSYCSAIGTPSDTFRCVCISASTSPDDPHHNAGSPHSSILLVRGAYSLPAAPISRDEKNDAHTDIDGHVLVLRHIVVERDAHFCQ